MIATASSSMMVASVWGKLDSGRCRRFGAAIDGYQPEKHFWSTV
jgi:hypothetical protein